MPTKHRPWPPVCVSANGTKASARPSPFASTRVRRWPGPVTTTRPNESIAIARTSSAREASAKYEIRHPRGRRKPSTGSSTRLAAGTGQAARSSNVSHARVPNAPGIATDRSGGGPPPLTVEKGGEPPPLRGSWVAGTSNDWTRIGTMNPRRHPSPLALSPLPTTGRGWPRGRERGGPGYPGDLSSGVVSLKGMGNSCHTKRRWDAFRERRPLIASETLEPRRSRRFPGRRSDRRFPHG